MESFRARIHGVVIAAIALLLLSASYSPIYANQFYERGEIDGSSVTYMKVENAGDTFSVYEESPIFGERARPFVPGPPCLFCGTGPEGNSERIDQSVLVGAEINQLTIRLSREGTINGSAIIGVFNGTDGNLKFEFGTLDVSTLSETPADYTFTTASLYTIVENDRIGISYTGGNLFNHVGVAITDSEHAFDWESSTASVWFPLTDGFNFGYHYDLVMTLAKKSSTYPMDVSAGTNINIVYRNYPILTEMIKNDSVLVGESIDQISLRLAKSGNITGMATIGVFDASGNVKSDFGTVDVSMLSSSSTEYTFTSPDSYTITAGDRIGISYSGGDSENYVALTQSNVDLFDTEKSEISIFINRTNSWCHCRGDLNMKLSSYAQVGFLGIVLQDTGDSATSKVWVALSTGEIASYPVLDASQMEFHTVGGDPTYITITGDHIAFTQPNTQKVGVLDVSNGTLIHNIEMPDPSWNPMDISTFIDNPDSGVVFFTINGTKYWGEMQTATGTVTYRELPTTQAYAYGITASLTTNKVFITDRLSNTIWSYDRVAETYDQQDTGSIGTPYFLTTLTTSESNELWGTAKDTNQIFYLGQSFPGSISSQGADPQGLGAEGPERIRLAGTDLLITYPQSDFVGAIHWAVIGGLPHEDGGNGHRATVYGDDPFDVVYDTVSAPDNNGNPGWHASYKSGIIVRGSHFPY